MSSLVNLMLQLDEKIVESSQKKVEDLALRFPEFEKFYKNLTKQDKLILTVYIVEGYRLMNKILYTNDVIYIKLSEYFEFLKEIKHASVENKLTSVNDVEKHFIKIISKSINELDQVFKKGPKIKKARIFYRGAVLDDSILNNILKTKRYHVKNFLSTSPFPEFSMKFLSTPPKSNLNPVLFEMTMMKGTSFIPNSKALAHFLEDQLDDEEIIFPRNLMFEVTSCEKKIYKKVKSYDKTLKGIEYTDENLYYIKLKQINNIEKDCKCVFNLKNQIYFVVDEKYTKTTYVTLE